MEPMFIRADGALEGAIRLDGSFKQIGGARSIEIAIAIIKSQTVKVPVPYSKAGEWEELNQRVLADLDEMAKKAKKMENLSKLKEEIKEDEEEMKRLREEIEKLEAKIQKEHEEERLLEE